MEPTLDQTEQIARDARVIAVVGMKDESRAGEPAFEIPRVCQQLGMKVIPVNPTIQSALGEKAYARLADVPDRFDMVNVFRRSERIPELAKEILALPPDRRPAVVWLQSGIEHEDAAERMRAAGLTVVQDACLGVIATRALSSDRDRDAG